MASTLQNEQIGRVRVCIPKGTSSNDVVQKVVWYLREKADADVDQSKVVTVSEAMSSIRVETAMRPDVTPMKSITCTQRIKVVTA